MHVVSSFWGQRYVIDCLCLRFLLNCVPLWMWDRHGLSLNQTITGPKPYLTPKYMHALSCIKGSMWLINHQYIIIKTSSSKYHHQYIIINTSLKCLHQIRFHSFTNTLPIRWCHCNPFGLLISKIVNRIPSL